MTDMTRTASGLQYQDTVVGGGDTARAGRQVTVHYTGWLHDPAAPNQRAASSTPARIATTRSASISAAAA